MTADRTAQVLVVGAGPVGLTLATDLARRGIAVLVAETRHEGEPPNVKCNHVAARSMEIFRRLGIAGTVREAGLPPDYPHDVAYRTAMLGRELTRIPIPSREGRRRGDPGPDTAWPTPEPPHRINQIFLEPILFRHAAATPGVTILNRTEIVGFEQGADGMQAMARNLDTDEIFRIEAHYLVGCDGGRSLTRRQIGAKLGGDPVVQRVQSTYIRAPGLIDLIPGQPAWAMFSLNPRRSGNVYAIDGRETWLVHNYLREDEADFESIDRDWSIRQILGVPEEFAYEVLSKEDWFGRRLVADRFRSGRVFLAGDAAHIWVPYAGYGMNAGIADATSLAWLLAARLNGWAPEAILDAYEAERLPITEQVSHFAMNHAAAMAKGRRAVPAEIEDDGPNGEAARKTFGQAMYDLNVQQYCCAGLNFGYFYDRSPLIAYDGETPPDYSMGAFESSTVPGCRMPHRWLDGGRSLYDVLGPDYALVRTDPTIDVSAFLATAATRGVPVRLLDAADQPNQRPHAEVPREAGPRSTRDEGASFEAELRSAPQDEEGGTMPSGGIAGDDYPLILVRPDQHIAWRGTAAPDDPVGLVDRIRGAGAASARAVAAE